MEHGYFLFFGLENPYGFLILCFKALIRRVDTAIRSISIATVFEIIVSLYFACRMLLIVGTLSIMVVGIEYLNQMIIFVYIFRFICATCLSQRKFFVHILFCYVALQIHVVITFNELLSIIVCLVYS